MPRGRADRGRSRSANYDDEDEDDFDLQSEMESGLVIGEGRGGKYNVSLDDRHVGSSNDFDEALKLGVQKMHDSNYFPNVFYVNERGNTDLLSIKDKVRKGKVVKVEYKYVRGWV